MKILDPTAEEMRTLLRGSIEEQTGEAWQNYEFDIESAIYWFAADYHGGQDSNLYSALSTSEFHPGACCNGPEPESTEESLYAELEAEYVRP